MRPSITVLEQIEKTLRIDAGQHFICSCLIRWLFLLHQAEAFNSRSFTEYLVLRFLTQGFAFSFIQLATYL